MSLLLALAMLELSPALARGTARKPTRAQVRAAVRQAERSQYLWTTINICNTKRHPLTLGIRGQMPALGFASVLDMKIHALYWSRGKFVVVPKVQQVIDLGSQTGGLHQGGVSLRFAPGAGRLSGRITFQWKLAGKVIAQATRTAAAGHPSADYGDPTHHTSEQCLIP